MREKERPIVRARLLSPKGPTVLRAFIQVRFVIVKVEVGPC